MTKHKSLICLLSIMCIVTGMRAVYDARAAEAKSIVIKNKKKPTPPIGTLVHFQYKEEMAIIDDDRYKEPLFSQISSLDIDDKENIYLLDMKACNILVFDKEGRLVRKIGSKGQGPGELMLPVSISMYADSAFIVYDVGTSRINRYSLDGQYLSQWNASLLGERLMRIVPDSLGGFYGLLGGIGDKISRRLIRLDREMKPLSIIGEISFPRTGNSFAQFFEPAIFFTTYKGDKMIWGQWHNYELIIVEADGTIDKRIAKDYLPLKISKRDKDSEIFARYGKEGLPQGVTAVFPKYLPAFRFIAADDDGRIYVRTFEKTSDDMNIYDVYNSDGVYIAKIPLPHHPAAMKKNKFYIIDTDNEGRQSIKRYGYEWK